MTFSLKVDVDQKIQAVSTDVKTLSKSVSDLKQLSTTIDTIEKQRIVLPHLDKYTIFWPKMYDLWLPHCVLHRVLHSVSFEWNLKSQKSPIQIVQNFKTMVGYERRITTDEMGKYYADKQSVQRKAIHNSQF